LDNIPLVADGVSLADVVDATMDEGRLRFTHAVELSGHSTYRLMVSPEALGCKV
jgi:hypothetical protein